MGALHYITKPFELRGWINALKRSSKSKNIEAHMANLLPKDEELFAQIAESVSKLTRFSGMSFINTSETRLL